jgi:hypothetical protein
MGTLVPNGLSLLFARTGLRLVSNEMRPHDRLPIRAILNGTCLTRISSQKQTGSLGQSALNASSLGGAPPSSLAFFSHLRPAATCYATVGSSHCRTYNAAGLQSNWMDAPVTRGYCA